MHVFNLSRKEDYIRCAMIGIIMHLSFEMLMICLKIKEILEFFFSLSVFNGDACFYAHQ